MNQQKEAKQKDGKKANTSPLSFKPISRDPLKREVVRILSKALHQAHFANYEIAHGEFIHQDREGIQEGSSEKEQWIEKLLSVPPDSRMGHWAFPCFQLSRSLKKSPQVLAKELVHVLNEGLPSEELRSENLLGENSSQKVFASAFEKFEKIEALGPYVNFTFSLSFLGSQLLDPLLDGDFLREAKEDQKGWTMIEFSQPNTHKEIHVGHMRNASLGDALVKILRYTGKKVVSSTFPGDVGTHVAKCLWYLKFRNRDPIPLQERGEWLGQMYTKAHLELEGMGEIEEIKSIFTQILKEIREGEGAYFDLWKETRGWSIETLNHVYLWAGIKMDQWYWESEVDQASVDYVKELYRQGKLVQSQGAIGMDLSDLGLGFCLLLKSDGTGLYATKDLELARRKFQDYAIDRSIYVVDVRQSLHFQQVFKVLERLGFSEASRCYHLAYNFVELPEGAMSSRRGNIIPFTLLARRMEDSIRSNYLNRYLRRGESLQSPGSQRSSQLQDNQEAQTQEAQPLEGVYQGSWSQQEVDLVAHQVSLGAIKYGMLRIDPAKVIVFNMEEWLRLDGDSGPFIQYSVARIHSLCEKLSFGEKEKERWSGEKLGPLLVEPSERELLRQMIFFHTTVEQVAEDLRPSTLCTYLYDLARCFNLFYHECSIGQAASADLREARLGLSWAVREVLVRGLELLGIPAPYRM